MTPTTDKVKEIWLKCFDYYCTFGKTDEESFDAWLTTAEGSRLVGELVEDWISVEDRLPKFYDTFSETILGCDGSRMEVGNLYKQYDGSYSLYHLRAENYIRKVTHWQPLPKPPKIN